MQVLGIDISHWQGNFDFNSAKAEGVEFVILKAGGGDKGLYKDSKFDSNYKKAKDVGISVGAYFFGNALTVQEAINEANKFLSIIQGKQFEYPVYYDVEGKMISKKKSKTLLTDIVLAFCQTVESAGYFTGIYSTEYVFNHEMEDNRLTHFAHWVARWVDFKPSLSTGMDIGMWQFGGEVNKLRSNKIAGVVCDQDYCFVDYTAAIKKKKLNGFDKEVVPEEPMGFKVSVSTPYLNVRTGPGTNYPTTGRFSGVGIFTVTDVLPGTGSKTGWGKIDKGWIALDFTKRV